MKTIAFVTQKGGAGKTTLAISLAVEATRRGETVVALDLDPQGTLASWGTDRKADTPTVDRLLPEHVTRLSDILTRLAGKGFTLAILDCPGAFGTVTNLAMKSADLCLIPARPTKLDLQATKATVHALKTLGKKFAFVLNQCSPAARSNRADEAKEGLQLLEAVASPFIMARTDFQDSVAGGYGVTEYAVVSKAADEVRELWNWIANRLKDIP